MQIDSYSRKEKTMRILSETGARDAINATVQDSKSAAQISEELGMPCIAD